MDKIIWGSLARNPNAIHLLEKNMDKIDLFNLSENPNAIHLYTKLDTELMKQVLQPLARELCEYVFHPVRMMRLAENCCMELDEYMELY
jgi:hypothetical protein